MKSASTVSSDQPFASKKFIDVEGHRLAYIDEGQGPAVVFQHGNPASTYLWRNVMRVVEGVGRLVAVDLMGMGDSAKLDPALGRDRYNFREQRKFLDSAWDALNLGDDVILVLHDVGSMFGFDWARRHEGRIQGIAYMEAVMMPLITSDFPKAVQEALWTFQTEKGREASLSSLAFLERFLLSTRNFSEVEKEHYRQPFLNPGEDRRPMFSFELPIDGQPKHTAQIVDEYSHWLSFTDLPKLFVRADPGYLIRGRLLDFARSLSNQTEITVTGTHFIQETAPVEIGLALAAFIQRIRS